MPSIQLLEPRVGESQLQLEGETIDQGPICPLTGSHHIEVLEEFPTSLLTTCYQRDFGIDVTSEFNRVDRMQLCRSLTSELLFFYPSITGSSEFYRRFQAFDWYYPEAKFEYERASAWIQPGHHVLDIGCGGAQFARTIPLVSYTGLEPNEFSPKRRGLAGINILPETITDHAKTYAQAYDVVCAFQVLEHVADPREFLTDALACLKHNGVLVLGVPSAESYITRMANFMLNAPPHHVTWWTDQALRHLADQFNLSILNLAHAPVEPWETRLYWMQRISNRLMPQSTAHFTESRMRRFLNIVAYIAAGADPIEGQAACIRSRVFGGPGSEEVENVMMTTDLRVWVPPPDDSSPRRVYWGHDRECMVVGKCLLGHGTRGLSGIQLSPTSDHLFPRLCLGFFLICRT